MRCGLCVVCGVRLRCGHMYIGVGCVRGVGGVVCIWCVVYVYGVGCVRCGKWSVSVGYCVGRECI